MLRVRIPALAATALFLGAIACDQPAPTSATARPNLDNEVNQTTDIILVVPNPCTDELLDVVTLTGKVHYTVDVDVDPTDPDASARLHINSAGLRGEGTSGDRYSAQILNPNTRLVVDPLDNTRLVARDFTRIRLLNQGPGEDLIVEVRFFIKDGMLQNDPDVRVECDELGAEV